jgi:hypothetical protein
MKCTLQPQKVPYTPRRRIDQFFPGNKSDFGQFRWISSDRIWIFCEFFSLFFKSIAITTKYVVVFQFDHKYKYLPNAYANYHIKYISKIKKIIAIIMQIS